MPCLVYVHRNTGQVMSKYQNDFVIFYVNYVADVANFIFEIIIMCKKLFYQSTRISFHSLSVMTVHGRPTI